MWAVGQIHIMRLVQISFCGGTGESMLVTLRPCLEEFILSLGLNPFSKILVAHHQKPQTPDARVREAETELLRLPV